MPRGLVVGVAVIEGAAVVQEVVRMAWGAPGVVCGV
jgi:hypothetical protein